MVISRGFKGWKKLAIQTSQILNEYIDGKQLAVVKRSVLGSVSIYNVLPAEIVKAKTVKNFQQLLQHLAKNCANGSHPQ